MKFCQTV